MKPVVYPSVILFLLIACSSQLKAQFQFISPVPGSRYHNPQETIILRNGELLDENSLRTKKLFQISGSLSGIHDCEVRLAEEGKTIILRPQNPFKEGEAVHVNIGEGIKTISGNNIHGTAFDFYIRMPRTAEEQERIAQQMQQLYREELNEGDALHTEPIAGEPNFPAFTINTNNNPSAGQIFFHNFSFIFNDDSHYCIIQNNGDSVYGKFDTVRFWGFDMNHNGYLTLNDRLDTAWIMLDSNYNEIASYKMGNGYAADVHEFQIFPDGHRYMMAYDPQIVDMTVYDPNYSPNATVTGLVIQELDESDNVLFQWRSWDHFQITDCDHINLALSVIDAVHGNSIEKLADGNIMISSRHLSELTKINRSTGDIIWRLGGKNNQFTFINDADKFTFQHDARMLSNGNITVFDNGNYHTPPRSWAKEYQIDEINKTATLVWSYSRTVNGTNVYGNALGSVERLANGNTFICWGNVSGNGLPNITEVDPNKNVVWELQLSGNDLSVYRSRKHDWQPCSRPSASSLYVNKITSTTAKVHWDGATNASSYEVYYRKVGNINWKHKTTDNTYKKLKNLFPDQTYEYKVHSFCTNVPTPSSGFTDVLTFDTDPLRLAIDEASPFAFTLYPNPASDKLHIEMQLREQQAVSIILYNVQGSVVLNNHLDLNEGDQSVELDIRNIPSGIYIAEVKTAEAHAISKFVKE